MEQNKESVYPEYYPQKEFPNIIPISGQPQMPNYPIYYDPSQSNQNPNSNFQNMEKTKRHRRGKSEINDRNYRCPDCDKCYLSGPALTTHRKTKHQYGINGEKRARGRPRKEFINENAGTNPQNKFLFFFGEEHRKILDLKDIINLDIIKRFMQIIFKQCKESIFNDIENVDKYDFYNLIIDNWEKDEPEFVQECFSSFALNMNLQLKGDIENYNIKVQSYNLDSILFFYLKEFYKFVNEKYFWFMLKFVILFREYFNQSRKHLMKNGENKIFSQLYNAEIIPEMFNEFILDFLEDYDYFGLNKEELIELIQHFCYWLNINRYSQTQLSVINNS